MDQLLNIDLYQQPQDEKYKFLKTENYFLKDKEIVNFKGFEGEKLLHKIKEFRKQKELSFSKYN